MSAPSIESPPGAQIDPPDTTNKLEQAVDQLNANMDMMSTLLGQLCQRIPTGECSREARETASPDPTDTEESGRKRHRREEHRLPKLKIRGVCDSLCIQLFRERLSDKTLRDNAERYYG